MKFDLSKILGRFNDLNDQARYAILGGVVLLIILLDVFFLVLPQINGIAHVNDQIKKLSEDTQQVLTDRHRINRLRKNLQGERVRLSSLSRKVRSIQEVPAILGTISNIAKEYGVIIDQLVPQKDRQEDLTTTADGRY